VIFHFIVAWTLHGLLVDSGEDFFIRSAAATAAPLDGQACVWQKANEDNRDNDDDDAYLEEALVPEYLGMPVCRQILFLGKVSPRHWPVRRRGSARAHVCSLTIRHAACLLKQKATDSGRLTYRASPHDWLSFRELTTWICGRWRLLCILPT